MGTSSSQNICGADSFQDVYEKNQTETYLPSNFYPYHINHLQNSEYHPRTYRQLETEQDDYNQFTREQLQRSRSPVPYRKEGHQFAYQTYSMQNSNINSISNNKQVTENNLDKTMNYNFTATTKEPLSPLNTNSMKHTYTSPFQYQSSSKLQQVMPQKQNINDTDEMKEQQRQFAERVKRLAEIINFAPVLRLTVIASANLKKDLCLTINAQGLLNGLRNEKDGYVFFGCKKKAKKISKDTKQVLIINDFIIPPTDPVQAKQQRGRHFQIKYDIKNNFYTIVDLGVGFGAFKKATTPHILRNQDLINFGLTLCTIKFTTRENPNKSFSQKYFQNKEEIILKAQFYGGYSNGEVYELDPKEYQEVTLGRSEKCSLYFKDKLISKVQCLIQFNPNIGWILKDGDGSLPSTNGTWIYLQKEEQIVDGMIIKANQTMFQASIH
ncbi:hypothetical protein ABPG74_018376 [Tetrahymena malaccensis]